MLPRERMLTALRRREPDLVPIALASSRMILPQFPRNDADEYFQTDIRYVTFEHLQQEKRFLDYLEHLPKHVPLGGLSTLRNYWEWDYHPETPGTEPLATARTVGELETFLLHKITDPSSYQHLSESVRAFRTKGLPVMGKPPHLGGDIFETAWRLRGFKQFMLDLRRNRDLVEYLLNQISHMLARSSLVLARAGVDILGFGDDLGHPTSMIISPAKWRELIKPRMAKVIKLVKSEKPDILIFYHSDGYIVPIIPDLIEIGVDVLNPVQPDVMDPARLKEKYGERLAFWGTVGTQRLWAWGSTKDMEEQVKLRIETVGRGGGFVISPAYDIDLPEIPVENIMAFNMAARKFGRYS